MAVIPGSVPGAVGVRISARRSGDAGVLSRLGARERRPLDDLREALRHAPQATNDIQDCVACSQLAERVCEHGVKSVDCKGGCSYECMTNDDANGEDLQVKSGWGFG